MRPPKAEFNAWGPGKYNPAKLGGRSPGFTKQPPSELGASAKVELQHADPTWA